LLEEFRTHSSHPQAAGQLWALFTFAVWAQQYQAMW